MAGNKEGAKKRKLTMIKKLGGVDQYYAWHRAQAGKGGASTNPNHPTNFRNNRALASTAGRNSRAKNSTHANEVAVNGSKLGIE